MELTKKQATIKYCVYCLLIVIADLMQNVGGLWFEIGGARCFFVIPVAVILGIDEEEKTSALLGFFAGLLWDCVARQHMGFNCIFLMLLCFVISSFVSYLFRPTYWICALSAVFTVFLYCIIYWLLFMVIVHSEGSVQTIASFYIPSALYTSVMTLALCALIMPLKRKLNKEVEFEK